MVNRIGLFGGVFNPVHVGHLNTANEILIKMSLDHIYFVVSARPPHKNDSSMTSFHHRYNMVKLALEDNKAFSPCDIEMNRLGISYSIDTVRYFQERFGQGVHFITGQDAMEDIGGWRSAGTLIKTCNFIVVTRPGSNPHTLRDLLQGILGLRYKNLKLKSLGSGDGDIIQTFGVTGSAARIELVSVTAMDVSSSMIRSRLKNGINVKYLVPPGVEAYIKKEGLFV